MIKIIVCAIVVITSLFFTFLLWDMDTESRIKKALYSTVGLVSCICAASNILLLIYFICTYIE